MTISVLREPQKGILSSNDFKNLFDDYYSPLCRYSLKFLRHPELAEEIVQDIFVNIWDKRNELDIHTSYKSYLYKAVKNKSLDYLKSKFAQLDFSTDIASLDLQYTKDPLKELEDKELQQIVDNAILSLPEKCYAVFSMSRYGDYSNKEIASELGISEKTVENQITIAIKKIKLFIDSNSDIISLLSAIYLSSNFFIKFFTFGLGVHI